MSWKKLLAPAVIAVAVTLGGASVATASDAGGVASEARFVAQAATETATVTSTAAATTTGTATPAARITDPEVACASAASNPSLGTLCPLWQAKTLQERSQLLLGGLILRIANGDVEQPRKPAADERGRGRDGQRAKTVEACRQFLAEHPDQPGERARFCTHVIEQSTAAAASGATPSATGTVSPAAKGKFQLPFPRFGEERGRDGDRGRPGGRR